MRDAHGLHFLEFSTVFSILNYFFDLLTADIVAWCSCTMSSSSSTDGIRVRVGASLIDKRECGLTR